MTKEYSMNRTHVVFATVSLAWIISAGCQEDVNSGRIVADTNSSSTDSTATNDSTKPTFLPPQCPLYYEVVQLGTLGGKMSMGLALNNKGWVTGASDVPVCYEHCGGFLWKPNQDNGKEGEMIDFSIGDDPEASEFKGACRGNTINDRGEILGQGLHSLEHMSGWGDTPFYWSEATGFIIPPRHLIDINRYGVSVSHSTPVDMDTFNAAMAFTWDATGTTEALPVPDVARTGTNIDVIAINDDGYVIGHGRVAEGVWSAPYIWSAETGYKLFRTLEGETGGKTTFLEDFNNYNIVVGKDYGRPVVWDADGYITDIGLLTSPASVFGGAATGINDSNTIVGDDYDAHGNYPWVYCDGEKHLLSDMVEETDDEIKFGWTAAINNQGQILTNGYFNGIPGRPFLLFPVYPEVPTAD